MPDWKKFADLLGMAQYGDEVRAVEARKRKEGIEAEELGFKRSANQRAEAAASREAEEAEYGKTRRKTKERAEDLGIEGLELSNVGRRQENEWQGGRQDRYSQEQTRLDRQEKLEAQRLGITQEELRLRKRELAIHQFQAEQEALINKERLIGAQRENRIGSATEEAEIAFGKEKGKMRDSQKLNSLVTLYKSLPDGEEAEYVLAQIKQLMAEDAANGQAAAAAGANPNAGRPAVQPVQPNYAAPPDERRRKFSGL